MHVLYGALAKVEVPMNVPQLNYFLGLTVEIVANVASDHQVLTPKPRYLRAKCRVVDADLVQ